MSELPPDNVLSMSSVKKHEPGVLSAEQRLVNNNKKGLFSEWLTQGIVSVLLDARSNGVKVPPEFAEHGDLRLNFSYNFHVPDFNFNELGVWGSMSFDSGEFFCYLPWPAVYGIQSAVLNQGAVWFDDFPEDYDQEDVLGINEQACENMREFPPNREETVDNIIAVDFGNK